VNGAAMCFQLSGREAVSAAATSDGPAAGRKLQTRDRYRHWST